MKDSFRYIFLDKCLRFKHILVLLISIILASTSFATSNLNCLYKYTNTAFELPLKTLYAVHVTRKIPQDGVLRMSRQNAIGRLTQHFSLGQMVTPHYWGNWEDMPMAILAPASSLKNQLVNINMEDTFIVGDFKIPRNSIFIAREDISIPENFPIPTVRFSKNEKIRTTIQKFLKHPSQKFEDTPDYWKSTELSENNPSYKYHSETAFERIESIITDTMEAFYKNKPEDIFLVDINDNLKSLKISLQEILPLIQSMPLDTVARSSLNEKLQKLNQAVNILEAESKLLDLHKKTLRPLIPTYGEKIQTLSSSPEQLWDFINQHINEWSLERQFR